MSSLEQDLTELFTTVAGQAPDDPALLGKVRAGTRRRALRRRTGAALAAVAVLAGGALVATSLPSRGTASRYADPSGFLVDGRGLSLTFPLSPSYLPAGLAARTPRLRASGGVDEASWDCGVCMAPMPAQVVVYVGSSPDVLGPPGSPTTVGPRPASVTCLSSDRRCDLSWKRAPGQYVRVQGVNQAASIAALRRVAEGLRNEPVVHRPRLVLGLVPRAGCRLESATDRRTELVGDSLETACNVRVDLLTPQDLASGQHHDGEGEPVTLGGHRGFLRTSNQGLSVAPSLEALLDAGGGSHLLVTVPDGHGWDRIELDRFVAAIGLP